LLPALTTSIHSSPVSTWTTQHLSRHSTWPTE